MADPATSSPSGSGPPALVGRDRELALLRKRLAAALTSASSLGLIGREARIGETTSGRSEDIRDA